MSESFKAKLARSGKATEWVFDMRSEEANEQKV